MATLLEILKANGATEADLEQMKPLLSNKKYAEAIENEITAKSEWERKAGEASGKLSEFESQRNQFEVQAQEATKKVQEYDNWYTNQVTPALSKVQQEAVRAAAEAASARASLAKAKELYGFELPDDPTIVNNPISNSPIANAPSVNNPIANQPARTDLPDLSMYAKVDDIQRQADMVGQAIAQTQDLAWEHQQLFGYEKPVNFTSLREKAVAEKRPIRDIWAREMGVDARKAELAEQKAVAERAKYDAALASARQEGFEKGMSQSINPMTREPQNSRFGVSFTKRDTTSGKPWEAATGREQDRLQKVVSTLAKQGAA